ncbi:Uncharacterised protein [Salmonella enterica subsp. enterica]|nr:Uncharacterised protein [Salmonella enterica subsp. enterica]
MQHIAEINVAGIGRKNVAIDVVEHGQHAGELLRQEAMLVIHALVPLRRLADQFHAKACQITEIRLQRTDGFVVPAVLLRFNIQICHFLQGQMLLYHRL